MSVLWYSVVWVSHPGFHSTLFDAFNMCPLPPPLPPPPFLSAPSPFLNIPNLAQAAVKEHKRTARAASKELRVAFRSEAQRAQKGAAHAVPQGIRL